MNFLKKIFNNAIDTVAGKLITIVASPVAAYVSLRISKMPEYALVVAISVLAAVIYYFYERSIKQITSPFIYRFGIYWDNEANPVCLACHSHLYPITHEDGRAPVYLRCIKCDKFDLSLADDNGLPLSINQAKRLLKSS